MNRFKSHNAFSQKQVIVFMGTLAVSFAASSVAAQGVSDATIAFNGVGLGDQGIYIVDDDGSKVVQLTTVNDDRHPSWSLDREKIAFARLINDTAQIIVMDADGSDQAVITSATGSGFAYPAWAPSGARIAFAAAGSVDPGIYTMDTDGGNVIQVTNSINDRQPSWSPDGGKIAFTRLINDTAQIVVMDADGGNQAVITSATGSGFAYPAWAPNGARIAFAAAGSIDPGIYIMDVDGGNVVQLTDIANDRHPSWSPDGRKIAFARLVNDIAPSPLARNEPVLLVKSEPLRDQLSSGDPARPQVPSFRFFVF